MNVQNLMTVDSINKPEADNGFNISEDVEILEHSLQTVIKSALDEPLAQQSSSDLTDLAVTADSCETTRSAGDISFFQLSSPDMAVSLSSVHRPEIGSTEHAKNSLQSTSKCVSSQLRAGPSKSNRKTGNKGKRNTQKNESEENECFDENNVHEGDWVVVKFVSERKKIHRYVGQVINESLAGLNIKFARKINDRRFKWPEKPDICVIGKYQVIKKLPQPYFKSSSKRIGAFEFPKSLRKLNID
ncbi:unnamed protein product [Parnassius apollo]|uniref:(apollo) hypothetical protein n=1 Tax=Parnassius apollo TaxID=110799 RepID=A0A8S3XF71_PARAO|nr:unnamed protein product [Parnassius apollo]